MPMICILTLMLFFSFQLFAQGEPPPPPPVPPGQNMWSTIIIVAIAIVFFYFILWRPEMKRRKVLETQRSALKKGDRVTAMGILGTVVKVTEATVVLELYDGGKMEVMKAAINDVVPGGPEIKPKE